MPIPVILAGLAALQKEIDSNQNDSGKNNCDLSKKTDTSKASSDNNKNNNECNSCNE